MKKMEMKRILFLSATLIVALFGLISCSKAAAQDGGDPYRDEVETMLQLTNAREVMEAAMTASFTNARLPVEDLDGLSRAIADEIWDDYVTECVVPVYKKHFTLDELKEVNKFYKTPVGKKAAGATPGIASELSAMTMQKYAGRIQKVTAEYVTGDRGAR